MSAWFTHIQNCGRTGLSYLAMKASRYPSQAAVAGMGIMLQPAELVSRELSSGALVALFTEFKVPVRTMHVLYSPDRQMTPKLRSFIDFADKTFG